MINMKLIFCSSLFLFLFYYLVFFKFGRGLEKCRTLWADHVGPGFKIFFIGKLHMHLIGFDEIALHIALTMGEEVPLELELVWRRCLQNEFRGNLRPAKR